MILVLIWLSNLSRFFAYIKKNDPDTFDRLGKPNIFTNNTPLINFKLLSYLIKKEYQNCEDQITKTKARYLRLIFILFTILMLLTTLCSIYSFINPTSIDKKNADVLIAPTKDQPTSEFNSQEP